MGAIQPTRFSQGVSLASLADGYTAVVVGATGGIGAAVSDLLGRDPNCGRVIRLGRQTEPMLDLEDEASIERATQHVSAEGPLHLLFDATGILHRDRLQPEKSLRALDPEEMAQVFAINAIGPALLMKHFHRLLPRDTKSVLASLSARVGSIGDNRTGGWYSYRASKAALNMFWRTAAIEIARLRPQAVCLALHPGTVATPLSAPFAGGRPVERPEDAARRLLAVVDGSDTTSTGSFFAYDGTEIPW